MTIILFPIIRFRNHKKIRLKVQAVIFNNRDMDMNRGKDSTDMDTVGMDKAGNKDKVTELQVLPAEKSDDKISYTAVFHTIDADFAAEFLAAA